MQLNCLSSIWGCKHTIPCSMPGSFLNGHQIKVIDLDNMDNFHWRSDGWAYELHTKDCFRCCFIFVCLYKHKRNLGLQWVGKILALLVGTLSAMTWSSLWADNCCWGFNESFESSTFLFYLFLSIRKLPNHKCPNDCGTAQTSPGSLGCQVFCVFSFLTVLFLAHLTISLLMGDPDRKVTLFCFSVLTIQWILYK